MTSLQELKSAADAAQEAFVAARSRLAQSRDAVLVADEARRKVLLVLLDGNATLTEYTAANAAVNDALTALKQTRTDLGL